MKEVQLMLGHSKPEVTLSRYASVLESMRARTDEALGEMFRQAGGAEPVPSAGHMRDTGGPEVVSLGSKRAGKAL